MKTLSGMFSIWTQCFPRCCEPVTSDFDEKSCSSINLNNSFSIVYDKPSLMPQPTVAPLGRTWEVFTEEPAPRKRRGSGWSSFSARKRLLPSNTSIPRRPRISAPTNFRHVYSESFHFPVDSSSQVKLQPTSFRPLELNLNSSDTQLSPILPHLSYPSPPVTPPPRAYAGASRSRSSSPAVSHQRSYSSIPFSIPRRPVNGGSVFDSPRSNTSTPQRLQPLRMRAYTSPAPPSPIAEDLVERVANAILERDRLQERIDDVVERQSIYVSSRPSTAHGHPEMEPMPEVPAMPPNAPSFSERLSSDHIQSTSTKPPVRTRYEANSSRKMEGRVPPPPLPLRLRPPLRKKKSFSRASRVSSWLFPAGAEHKKGISFDSITNAPRPVAGGEGFYQVARPERRHRSSFDSESIVSDWTVEEQTLPTSLSLSSATTPRTVGPSTQSRQRKSVGIAF
ncbi:hypothetical protein F5B22DRAFT_570297 [Xylaria bambusicola]|uniref:uncharacterized protein n=1 Tax=Xylaria bambusicola TaxID=326684 RepID=UPI0020078DF8|nr:uncharacterized protein F5B22DRAFT_570297 [Xylaria bambusicola]KAI0521350.1 hypothetical protein F5B22DRAFT_570297 [Xylaria bambusicola]